MDDFLEIVQEWILIICAGYEFVFGSKEIGVLILILDQLCRIRMKIK